ncbi:MAG: glycine betaine ABC transporter substrate-binding protein [Anaerolineales bacterium]|jgi:osmoprotectant transport system substrate-binding protein
MRKHYILIGVIIILGLVLASCGGGGGAATIRIGSKEFTEQHLLGNMYQMLLEDAGYEAEYTPLGGTTENHAALMAGEIDVYPEYTGTALMSQLGMSYDPSMTADDVYQTVVDEYAEQYNLAWGTPTAFNNTYCLTMKADKADELGIETLTDLSTAAPDLVFGTTQEFTERDDGLPGLQTAYGGFQFAEVVALDPGLKYAGIDEGDLDVTTCFGTDGQIAAFDLVVLEDDLGFWPPYPVGPVIRQEVLDENPEIATILDNLAPLLDGPTMAGLNWEVDGNSREADEVAREFLVNNGLIDN